MISQRDSLNEELQRALDHNKCLERQLAEYGDRIHWLEKKIQTFKDLQRDSRIRLDVKLKKARDLKKKQGEDSSFDVAKLCSEFSFAEIKEATDNFNPSLKIGEGGYGIVYKGFLRHNEVAIKVWDNNSRQGSMEFRHEGDEHVFVPLSYCSGLENFWMSTKCVRELLVGFNWLDMSILQFWCEYIHHLCIENNISEVYGLLDPVVCNIIVDGKASNQKISQGRCKQYIQKKLQNEKKECLLISFNHGGHWQLIILCPNTNNVVVLCSLHRALNPTMKNIVSSAFTVHQMANGNRKNNTQWLYPKISVTKKQPNSIDCGYYVMKNMLDIVSANITRSWMEVFNDPTELSSDEMHELRKIWATYFLELYKG
ncbi:U-box domain-containing protein [Trifolium repens]|nr:U-box domain-containing protein [Trifolium repens]